MRLRRLDLTRYGKFSDYSIDFGEPTSGTPDLHIIYGLNEAGKSTSLSAYLDLLFGIEERTRYGFLHPGKAMEIGACLEFDGNVHEFKRVKQRSNSLLSENGQPVNEAILSVPLAGLSRDSYRMMFSLDDQTLEEGGNAILESKSDLGELLFSASAGLAGITSILESAVAEADNIFRKRASSTKIANLKRQIAELKSQRDEIDVQASAYRMLTNVLEQAEEDYDAAMKEIGTAKARQEKIARVLRAYPLAIDYRRREIELSQYKDLPSPPPEWVSALPGLIVEETRLQTELAGLQQRERKIREELGRLATNERLLAMTDRLDQLADAAARYATAEEDLPKRKDALSASIRKVDLILTTLGRSEDVDPKTLLIPAATIGTLRDLISEKSGIDVARQSAEKEHDAERQHLQREQRAWQALNDQGATIDVRMIAQLQSELSRLRNGNLVAELRIAERDVPGKRLDFDDAVGGLHPWTGDGDALLHLKLPSAERVEAWKLTHSGLEKRHSQLRERERELFTKRDEDIARIAALPARGQVKADAPGRGLVAILLHGAQRDGKLGDMLDQLGLGPHLIAAVEGDDVGVEIADPLDPQDARLIPGKTHGDLLRGIKLLFEVADIKDQPVMRPFGGAFRLFGLCHRLGHIRCFQFQAPPSDRERKTSPRCKRQFRCATDSTSAKD